MGGLLGRKQAGGSSGTALIAKLKQGLRQIHCPTITESLPRRNGLTDPSHKSGPSARIKPLNRIEALGEIRGIVPQVGSPPFVPFSVPFLERHGVPAKASR